MKVENLTDQPLTNEACKAATGKTMEEWFEVLDGLSDPKIGRRDRVHHIYEATDKDAWWASTLAVEYEAAKGQKEKDGRLKGYFICSTKTLNVPVESAYNAWTSPNALANWFGDVKLDLKDGGELVDSDGNRATFKRIRENKDLRFTWIGADGEESLVDVSFADKGNGKTGLLINHDRIQTRAEADGIRRAWSEALDKMKAYLEKA